MNLNDLLRARDIDPQQVLVLRHRPSEPSLNRALPRLAEERPGVFNAYQQFQTEKLENVMRGGGYVASFIGREPRRALFVGLYSIGESKPLSREEYWEVPGNIELKKFGMKGFTLEDPRPSILQFDLRQTEFYASWKGKLVVGWPPPERSWWRRAHRGDMPVLAIHMESELVDPMPSWDHLDLGWEELADLPGSWEDVLRQWRVIYYIFDSSAGKGYVGSAYGEDNVLGRWRNYASSGHGGNSLLRERNPRYFRFTILERVSPDLDKNDVLARENTWKERLHTRDPFGLNDN